MSLVSKVRVRVPATTSNLGPGFDCLGLALGLYNELTLERHSEPGKPVVEISGEGEKSLPKDENNLLVKAARTVIAGRFPDRLVFKAVNRIPLARGLGSSAAAIVAGLFAANRLLEPSPMKAEQLFEYGVVLEGHPDNVAPAISGGLVVSYRERRNPKICALEPHAGLRATVCIPDFELSTSEARAVLPKTFLRESAVENVARALMLASALERGRWDVLAAAMEDQFHQPYRSPLIPGFADVLRAAREAGACGSALSGAGPAILALFGPGVDGNKIGHAMQEAFGRHAVRSRALELPIDRQGVELVS